MLKLRSRISALITIAIVVIVGVIYSANKPSDISILDEYLSATPPPLSNDVFVGEEAIPPIPIPEFELIDYTGEPITNEDLKGKIVLLTFAYTSCPDVCPIIFAKYLNIQKELGEVIGTDVELAIISVDPEVDTPERLAAHRKAMSGNWHFITGDLEEMQEVWDSFGLYVEKVDATVNHLNLSYLIDENGLIRVQYVGLPPASAYLADIQKLIDN